MSKNMINYKVIPALLGITFMAGLGLSSSGNAAMLEEVIVTAQKREQSVQDVPVAVTAFTQEMIQTNRIQKVTDLSNLVPGLIARPASGGVNIASFSMRGINSIGVVAGSDKQVSTYLDGVYIGANRASIFELPDISQLEVLRGPQGTIFGRNATAGAVSVTTRNPSGEFGITQDIGIGVRDHFRIRTTIDTPAWGPFSAYLTYVKETRDGDVINEGAGTCWDRTRIGENMGIACSPEKMGNTDTESFFLAIRYEPSDNFSLTYKFDYSTDDGAPRAHGAVVKDMAQIGPFGALVDGIIAFNNTPFRADGRRPDVVNNAWATYRDQEVLGHNLTAIWDITDNITLKNIAAYRDSEVFTPADITGWGGLLVGPFGAFLGGLPADTQLCMICSQADAFSKQWSNELQINYSSDRMTLTGGVLYYESDEESGSPENATNTHILSFFFNGPDGWIVPVAPTSRSFNESKSYAIYAEAEWHLTPQIDLVTGYRLTRDKKSGVYQSGDLNVGPLDNTPFDFKDTNDSYNVVFIYKPNEDLMLYAKHSVSFISGGNTAGLPFVPEDATSWEVGMKGEFLDNSLRANLALYTVDYKNTQGSTTGYNVPGFEFVALLILSEGDLSAKGAELELTYLPMDNLTLGMSLGWLDAEWGRVGDFRMSSAGVGGFPFTEEEYRLSQIPDWTSSLSVNYETQPLFGNAFMTFGATASWHSKMWFDNNPNRSSVIPGQDVLEASPSSWVVNARASLANIDFGSFNGVVALWVRNLTDNDYHTNALLSFASMGNYLEKRYYGVDLTVRFE